MDLRSMRNRLRLTPKNTNETDGDDEQDGKATDEAFRKVMEHFSKVKELYRRHPIKQWPSDMKNLAGDVVGTNMFSKYKPNKSKYAIHPIFQGSGNWCSYKSFKSFLLMFGILCPPVLLAFAPAYVLFGAEYAFNVVTGVQPSEKKEAKDIKPSHRQIRMAELRENRAKDRSKEKENVKGDEGDSSVNPDSEKTGKSNEYESSLV